MKNHKLLLAVGITFLIFILLNFAYYISTNWRSFLPKKSSLDSSIQIPESKTYDNTKMGINLKYPTLPLTPVDIGNASGFKYKDTDDHDSIWLLHSGKIYIVRVYYPNQDAKQILTTLKFM